VAVERGEFRHESMQDAESIGSIFEALAEGFREGRLTFQNDAREVVLQPRGMVAVEVRFKRDEGRSRLTLRLGWDAAERSPDEGPLVVGAARRGKGA